jgi:hypothetical protein
MLKILINNSGFSEWIKKHKIKNESFCIQLDNLYYIGTKHTSNEASYTFNLINNMISNVKPDLVIAEGFNYSYGVNYKYKNLKNSEMSYAFKIAAKNNIDYCGIESDEYKIFRKLAKQFTPDDITLYIFLRTHRESILYNLDEKEFIKRFNNDVENTFRKHSDPYELYLTRFGKPFKYAVSIEAINRNINNKINKVIFDTYNKERTLFYLSNLFKLMKKYNKIILIMGRNHVHSDYKILEKLLSTKMKVVAN